MTRVVPPRWRDDLHTLYGGRIARQFVLHFNLNDAVIDMDDRRELGHGEYERRGGVVLDPAGQLPTLREYLRAFLFEPLHCSALYTYSLADGLGVEEPPGGPDSAPSKGLAWGRLREAASALRLPADPLPPEGLPDSLRLLGHLLRQRHGEPRRESPIAVLIDYAEKLVPYGLEEGGGAGEQLQTMEVLQRWAVDPLIRRTNNVIVLLTDNLGQIPKSIHAEGSGCRAIRVPLPTEMEREAFIRFKMASPSSPFASLDPADFGDASDEQAHRLARATQGMRLNDIDNISRRVIVEHLKQAGDDAPADRSGAVLRLADVQRAKGGAIEAQSAGLLEIVPPVRGFAEIGGLETIKGYLKERTRHMLSNQHLPLVPSGLLLAGPPGTGKTIIAEALAAESRFNLVKMRSIQDRWVGSSERNLEMVLDLLDDLHPVVVFVDEVDQAMGRRDTGQSGDGGVGARMFGRILEAMSSPASRGRILWVAATNRADLLDDALLRRFDRVLPLLTPDVVESCHIFATMPRTIARQSGEDMTLAYGEELATRLPETAGTPADPFFGVARRTAELGLTGAAIEIVVRRAIELAYEEAAGGALPRICSRHLNGALDDFKANHNRATYDYQSLLAIRACNFRSVIPRLPDREPYNRIFSGGEIDHDRLDQEIARLARGGQS
jgi:SpoVK/Ycf46/Vps4 family AAA+-type ATPase